jgi:hypothetical protein
MATARASAKAAPSGAVSVTPRAVLLGLALAAANTWWVALAEVRWGVSDGSCLPLFITPIFILALLTALNLGLRRIASRWALSQVELLTVYIVIVISETLSGHDFVQNLFGTIGHLHWFATVENQWADLLHPHLQSWLIVDDVTSLEAFYEGGASFAEPWLLGPWLVPLAAWSAVLVALIGAMLCLNTLLQKHWTEHEKLAYPMVVLPLEMTAARRGAEPSFFADRLIWAGVAIGLTITLVNGIHQLYPASPEVPFIKLERPSLSGYPWRGLYRFYYGVYPFAVALAFFIPSDLSFSCWFFFLVGQAQMVGAELIGMREAPPNGFPYLAHQASGAWLALAVGALLTSREHIVRVWRQIWRHEDTREARLYRWAGGGLVACLAALVILLTAAGMSAGLVAGFLVVFFALSIAMTRVRAEFGTPHEIYYINPQRIIVNAVGTRIFGPRQLGALAATYWFNRCYRCHPMPFQLESMKIAQVEGIRLGSLVRLIALATVAGIVLSCWANLHITFREGAAARSMAFKSWVGRESWGMLANWLRATPGPDWPSIGAMAGGALIFWGLRRVHFMTMLPLHPAGYALAVSFAMNYFWSSFLVGWLIKVIVLRYSGRSGHDKAYRIFLGVLLGDYAMGAIWSLVGPLWGVRTYKNFI